MSDTALWPMHDDLEAYALGALEQSDERRFAEHLESCEPCRTAVSSYVPVTNALRSIATVAPPPMPRVDASLERVVPLPARFSPLAFAYAAAAAVLLVLGAGWYGLRQQGSDDALVAVAGMMADGPRQAALTGVGTRGRVIIGRRNRRAAVIVRGLPAPPRGSAYHVWLMDSAPVMVGALAPARDNLEVLLVDAARFAHGHRVQVSLETADARLPSASPYASGRI